MFKSIKSFVLRDIVLEIKDIRSLALLRNVYSGYVPWTGASIHPTALTYMLNDITIHGRKHVVECGSGISTLYVASLLKQQKSDTVFHSIDHDENWINILKSQLEEYDLMDYVRFIHAPLSHCKHSLNEHCLWYDTDKIESEMDGKTIDLLFIDGPPANQKNRELSRYPAIPVLKPYLAENYTVILDDASRKSERTIAGMWNRESGFNFKEEILNGDISIATRGNRYNVL